MTNTSRRSTAVGMVLVAAIATACSNDRNPDNGDSKESTQMLYRAYADDGDEVVRGTFVIEDWLAEEFGGRWRTARSDDAEDAASEGVNVMVGEGELEGFTRGEAIDIYLYRMPDLELVISLKRDGNKWAGSWEYYSDLGLTDSGKAVLEPLAK